MVNTSRGRSGATFSIGDWSVVKRGNRRVGEQGRWLRSNFAPSLPGVMHLSDTAYSMEKLTSFPIHLIDTRVTLDQIASMLQRDLWRRPAHVKFDAAAHAARLAPLPMTPFIASKLAVMYRNIEWDCLATGLTHGDPILDNVMIRPDTGELVLTDPIPATPALPDLLVVDMGRLFQSAAGYERITYGLGGPSNATLRSLRFTDALSPNELHAAHYFGIVHCLRAMVYVDRSTADAIAVHCIGAILDEVQWKP